MRVQILETDGTVQTAAEGTVRVSGGWSRSGVQLKNLHTKLKDGAQTDLLAAAPGGENLSTVVLRGSGNGTAYQSLHQDAFLNNYLYDLDIGTQWNEPVILFLRMNTGACIRCAKAKTKIFMRVTTPGRG